MGLFDWFKPDKEPEPQLAAPQAPTKEDIETALVKAERLALEGSVPTPVLARVLRITTMVRAIVPRLSNLGLSSQDGYTVVATATDYLPESVSAYLALPRDWADTRPVADGKSSLLLLVDQLDLLALTTQRMADAANRLDASALVAQGGFLDAKFGGHKNVTTAVLPPQPAASGSILDLDTPLPQGQ